jgi:hypothetical protein
MWADLSSCVALRSTAASESSVSTEPRLGNYYFLPRGLIQLDGAPLSKDAPTDFQVTVKSFNVPDKDRRFFLRQRNNPFYEDDLQLKINGKGLLETVNISTEDKTPAIIDKVTETFIDVARIGASGSNGLFQSAKQLQTAIALKPFHVVFDPSSPAERNAARARLEECGFKLEFPDATAAKARVASDSKDRKILYRVANDSTTVPYPATADGILYRPPTAVDLEISTLDNSQTGLLQHVFVRVPNRNEIAVMDASRSFLIKKKNNYALVDGDLIQIDHNRPSQALALVGIPASVVHKVAEAIPTIIAIQDKRASRVPPELAAQKAQLDAQTAVLNSQIALIEARKKAQGDGPTNRALTRDALVKQAEAENEEALLRVEKVNADKEEATARKAKAQAENEEAQARVEKAKADKEEATARARRAATPDTSANTPERPKAP